MDNVNTYKANEAPVKIYLQPSAIEQLPYQNIVYTKPLAGNSIEYTRTDSDSFIEKACEWLRNNSHNYANNALGKEYLVNDFKNYMKGE